MKKKLSEVRQDLHDVTDQISTQVRTITLGVLAVAWLGLSGAGKIEALNLGPTWQLTAIAGLCIVTLFADLVQYGAGYSLVKGTLLAAERAKQSETSYNTSDWRYAVRIRAFELKQWLAAASALWLVGLILVRIVCSSQPIP